MSCCRLTDRAVPPKHDDEGQVLAKSEKASEMFLHFRVLLRCLRWDHTLLALGFQSGIRNKNRELHATENTYRIFCPGIGGELPYYEGRKWSWGSDSGTLRSRKQISALEARSWKSLLASKWNVPY